MAQIASSFTQELLKFQSPQSDIKSKALFYFSCIACFPYNFVHVAKSNTVNFSKSLEILAKPECGFETKLFYFLILTVHSYDLFVFFIECTKTLLTLLDVAAMQGDIHL